MRLHYIGKLLPDSNTECRLWEVIAPGHPVNGSSLSIEGLHEWGVIK